ncbi:transmembrane protein 154 isoform X2 [Silurus meridionalis]|uniref:transmembrane protein 154 isoform X2 n=1 Tax=Silurus meridionalis TaxID=175797 RepID=UPI001EEC59AD|nr:transmembrane protein 154 isoform X2 [Silurus meridionalis]
MTEGWCYGTMSVSAQSKGHYCQRGLWEMTPEVLLLILALTACLTEPVHCEKDNGSGVTEKQSTEEQIYTIHQEPDSGDAETQAQVTLEQTSTTKQISNATYKEALNKTTEVTFKSVPNNETITVTEGQDFEDWENNTKSDTEEQEQDQLNIFIIIAVGLTLALLLTAFVATYLLKCRRTRKKHTDCEKEDPYLDDDIGEKVPMPMFEDDMPSVMELEMEDFEKWMIKEGSDTSMNSKQRHPS